MLRMCCYIYQNNSSIFQIRQNIGWYGLQIVRIDVSQLFCICWHDCLKVFKIEQKTGNLLIYAKYNPNYFLNWLQMYNFAHTSEKQIIDYLMQKLI